MDGSYVFEIQEPWVELGHIDLAQTTPGVSARDEAALDATSNVLVLDVPNGTPAAEFRFRSNDANNGSIVLDMFALRKKGSPAKDYYTRVATLTLTIGQQVANTGYVFVDTVVVSNVGTNQEIKAVSPANDYIGSLLINFKAYGKVLFVATTLTADKKVYVDVAYNVNNHVFLKA